MTVTSLSKVISESFITALTQVGSSLSSQNSSSGGTSLGPRETISVSSGLRSGARDFATGVQLLNRGITVINIARAANEKLLEVVDKLDSVVQEASRTDITQGKAGRLRNTFNDLASDFERLLKEASEQDINVFDATTLSGILKRSGLDPAKVTELETALKKIMPLTESRVDSEGNVTSSANLIPKSEFASAVRRSTYDPDEEGAERPSGGFAETRKKMRALREVLKGNIKAIDETADVIGRNIGLVRVVGLAMLELSGSIRSDATAADVADELQSKIRQGAPLLLAQANNLQAIAVAGLAVSRQQDKAG
jgi:hypothetical protein